MLGLVDFVRAARNSVRLALRRVHPLAGPVLIAVMWTVALGSVLWITREDDGRSNGDDASAYTERDGAGTRSVGRDDGDGSGGGSGDGGVGEVEWTDGADGSSGDGDDDGAGSGGDTAGAGQGAGSQDGTGPILESPGGPGPVTSPSTTGEPPSGQPGEPEVPGSTTTPTTAPPTTGPTTSTTVPAGGGLLDVVLGVLFP